MSSKIGQDRVTARHQGIATATADLPFDGTMPSFEDATTWLNSPPLTPGGLRGRVVLVQFWTYTCINWLRTLHHLRAWAKKYSDQGLVVIGVHTPEFRFEHDLANVRRATQAMAIEYPVAMDNDYDVWRAFANHYWPALYFVDAQGRIRHHRFGEGDFERSEMVIRQLLADAGAEPIPDGLVAGDATGAEAAADWADLRSAESYLGYDQASSWAGSEGPARDRSHVYAAPARLRLNDWALTGDWTVKGDAVLLNKPGGRIANQFHARDVHLVMGPAARDASVRFRVLIDGQAAASVHGGDVDEKGNGIATDQRMYQLVRQPKPIADRRFEIEFQDAGLEAFVFTFG
jgi:thiol-disulfide isomerase/thioredoxin